MFGPATFGLLSLLLAVSVLARYTPLFLLALTLLLAAGLSRIWERYCLDGLEFRRHLSHRRTAFGDVVEIELEIVNRKLLPLAWLEIEDEIPRALQPLRGRLLHSHKPGRALLVSLLALRPYERVRRRYQFPCRSRGEHQFGPVRLQTGDLFGLVRRELVLDQFDTLVVCPRVVPLGQAGLPAHRPLGDLRARNWLFEDPSRLAGTRDYRPEDGQRRIHWAASAHAQRLQTKVFEPAISHKLLICLNLTTTADPIWVPTYNPDLLELAIMTAASLASWGQLRGYQVGLSTNGMHLFDPFPVRIEPSASVDQSTRLQDALGRLQPIAMQPFDEILADESRRLAYGTSVVVVSAVIPTPLVLTLMALRRRGYPVTLVLAGPTSPQPALDGLAVRRVGPAEAWRELAELTLDGG
jgi:uncharacterized protein (DUF58 family)